MLAPLLLIVKESGIGVPVAPWAPIQPAARLVKVPPSNHRDII